MNKLAIYGIQLLFVSGIAFGRYVVYLLIVRAVPPACRLVQKYQLTGRLERPEGHRGWLLAFTTSIAVLLYYRENVFREDFVYVALAYLLVMFPEIVAKSSITYGVGMACSFFEGYLVHVIPSDGAKFVGFEENIRALEDKEGVCFPVKKLFIIITKNLFCPPDLKEFNKGTGMPYLDGFTSLEDVIKNVAGVKNRTYRNTAYKVYRGDGRPVCLMAECATPLHTLHRVLNNRTLYQEVADIDVAAVVHDFCSTLQAAIDKSPVCRGKCELVYYDNEDPEQNLAAILLERVRSLEPRLDELLAERRRHNKLETH